MIRVENEKLEEQRARVAAEMRIWENRMETFGPGEAFLLYLTGVGDIAEAIEGFSVGEERVLSTGERIIIGTVGTVQVVAIVAPVARGAGSIRVVASGDGALRLASPQAGALFPRVTDAKLRNIVDDLFKGAKGPNPIGTGSTADAVRNEIATGLATHGKFHFQKAREYIKALENWLRKNPNAPAHDRLVAESLKGDLEAALKGN